MRNDHIGTIREFKTRNFTVRVDADYDYDTDLSFDDDGSVRRDLESGKLVSFQVSAKVYLRGNEIAADYLGGCIYKSIEEFQDHRECGKQTRELRAKGSNAIVGSYFADMIHTVIEEARKALADMQSIRIRTA